MTAGSALRSAGPRSQVGSASTRASSSVSKAAATRRAAASSTLQVVGDTQHFVGRLNAFGVGLVRTLRRKHRHHRLDDRNVRLFEHSETYARPVAARIGRAGRAGCGGCFENRAAEAAQAFRRGELGRLEHLYVVGFGGRHRFRFGWFAANLSVDRLGSGAVAVGHRRRPALVEQRKMGEQ